MGSLMNLIGFASKENKTVENSQILSVSDRYEGADTWVAASCYLPFVSGAVLLIRKNNSDFVRFHAKQAFVILVVYLLGIILLPLIFKITLTIFFLALSGYGAFRATKGFRWYLPFVTELANSIEL